MRWIEVILKDNQAELISCKELDVWLRGHDNPRYARYIVTCYYRNRENGTLYYESFDGNKHVPTRRNGMNLEKVRL